MVVKGMIMKIMMMMMKRAGYGARTITSAILELVVMIDRASALGCGIIVVVVRAARFRQGWARRREAAAPPLLHIQHEGLLLGT